MDWQQRRALEMLSITTDSALASDGAGMVQRGSEAVFLTPQQIGQMMEGGLIKFCDNNKHAFEITDAGRAAHSLGE